MNIGLIDTYIAGWPILLPTFLALGWLAVYQIRRQWAWWAPQLIILWLGACLVAYATARVGRFLGYAELRWLFMVLTILVATAVPGCIVIAVARSRVVAARMITEHVGFVTLTALVVVPLGGVISAWMYSLFRAVQSTTHGVHQVAV
jgi:hypothetical protein